MFYIKNIRLQYLNPSIISLSILSVCIFLNFFDSYLHTFITPLKIGIPIIFAIILMKRTTDLRLPENLAIFALFVIFTLPSFFLSDDFLAVFLSLVGYIILMFIIANMDIIQDKMLWLVGALYFGGLCLALLCVLDLLLNGVISLFLGASLVEKWYGVFVFLGFESNPNGLASHLMPVVVISYALFISNQSKRQKCMHLVACLIVTFALIMTHSRSGALGASAGILVTLFFYLRASQSEVFKSVALAFVLVSILLLSPFCMDLVVSFLNEVVAVSASFFNAENTPFNNTASSPVYAFSVSGNKTLSFNIRLLTLPHFLNIAWDNMFFGVGFGQSGALVGSATGYFVGPHSIFLGVLVEYGFFAFCALLALIIWPCARGFMYIEARLRTGDIPIASIGIYSCFISFLIHGTFHKIYVNFSLWLFVALLMALYSGRAKHKKVSSHKI